MNTNILLLNRLLKFSAATSLFCLLFISFPLLAQTTIEVSSDVKMENVLFNAAPDVYKRLDNHEGSWVSLLIVLSSLIITFTLNHVAPKIRTMGTLLAARGGFAVVGWFIYVLNFDALCNAKEPLFAVDGLKPLFLWAQAVTSLLAGLFLLRVAIWQSQRVDTLTLPTENTAEKFGLISRSLHWVTAILFISLFPIGIFASTIPEGVSYRQGYYVAHKTIGSIVLFLFIVRIIWHIKTPTPSLESGLKGWERATAKTGHFLLYFLILALPISGFIMSTSAGKLSQFFIWDYPLLWDKNIELAKLFGLIHKIVLPYLCYVVIGAHILGVLKHHFVDKHYKSIHRMIS